MADLNNLFYGDGNLVLMRFSKDNNIKSVATIFPTDLKITANAQDEFIDLSISAKMNKLIALNQKEFLDWLNEKYKEWRALEEI